MRTAVFILVTCLCLSGAAQKMLLVDIYRPFGVKRIRIYPNETLRYKLKSERGRKKDVIVNMTDNALVFADGAVIGLREIKVIYLDRSNYVIRKFRKFLTIGGAGFIGLDAFNNLINGESPVFKERALLIGGSVFAAGCIVKLFEIRRVHPGRNRRIHIIDLSPT